MDGERDKLKGNVGEAEAEIAVKKRECENERKMIDDLVRERDILNKNLVKAANATAQQVRDWHWRAAWWCWWCGIT